MKRIYTLLLIFATSLFFTGCLSISNPFKSDTFVVKEGYLSLGKINANVAKQMPLKEKVARNEIKILNTTIYAGANKHSFVVECEYIFTSFEIPEGLPAIARFNSSLEYNPKTQEFKLAKVQINKIKFLKENLVEYITPNQKKFIPDTLTVKLYSLVLHKSKKKLKTIKNFEVKEGKIKINFN